MRTSPESLLATAVYMDATLNGLPSAVNHNLTALTNTFQFYLQQKCPTFTLMMVFSERSCSLYAVARPSVCLSSVVGNARAPYSGG